MSTTLIPPGQITYGDRLFNAKIHADEIWLGQKNLDGFPISPLSQPWSAVGDGVTDDTLALQTALDSLNYLYLPFGRVFNSRQLNILNKDHFAIFGGGKLVLRAASNSPLLYFADSYYNLLKDLWLDGNKANQANPYPLVTLRNSAFTREVNCHIFNSKGSGLYIENYNASSMADEVNVLNSFHFSNDGHGIDFGCTGAALQPVGDCLIELCHLNFNGLSGIHAYGGSFNSVLGCQLLTNNSHGIDIVSDAPNFINGVAWQISNNFARNNNGSGIYIHGATSSDMALSGNRCHYNNRAAGGSDNLDIFDSERPILTGNYCGDVAFVFRAIYGMQLANSHLVKIVANDFIDNVNAAPLIGVGCTYRSSCNEGLADL